MPKNELSVLFSEFLNERISQIEESDKDGVTPYITKVAQSGEELQATFTPEQMKLWNKHDNNYGQLIGEMTQFWYRNGFKDGLNIVKLLGDSLEN